MLHFTTLVLHCIISHHKHLYYAVWCHSWMNCVTRWCSIVFMSCCVNTLSCSNIIDITPCFLLICIVERHTVRFLYTLGCIVLCCIALYCIALYHTAMFYGFLFYSNSVLLLYTYGSISCYIIWYKIILYELLSYSAALCYIVPFLCDIVVSLC